MAGTGNDPNAPWGWVPAEWMEMANATQPVPELAAAPVLQPGLGIPSAAIDNAVAAAQTMPPPASPSMAQLQPGLGIPASAIDAAVSAPVQPNTEPMPFGPAPADAMPMEVPYAPPNAVVGDYEQQPIPAPESEPENLPPWNPDGALGDIYETATDPAKYFAKLDDEQLLRDKLEMDQSAKREALMRREEESLKNLEAQKANYAAREEADKQTRAKMEALVNEADRLSKTKVDPKRWWHNESTGGKVLAVISAFTGGLAAPHMGGRNVGLEMIRKNIDEDISAQMADLQNARTGIETKRGAVADQFRQHGDALLAAEQVRAATWGHVIRQLETEQQNYDPRGTIAMQLEIAKRQARAQQTAGAQKYEEVERERARKDAEYGLKVRKQIADELDAKEKIKVDRQKIWAENDRAAKALADKQEDRKLARETAADAKAQARQDKQDANELDRGIGGAPTLAIGADGKPELQYSPMAQRDGKPFVPKGSVASVDKLREMKSAGDQLVAILDEVERLGPEWLSDTRNSDKRQQLNALWGAAKLKSKDYNKLGVIAGPDEKLIDNFLGTGDVTAYKDSAAARTKARELIVAGMSSELKSAGLDHDYTIPKLTEKTAIDSADPAYLRAQAADFRAKANDPRVPADVREQLAQSAAVLEDRATKSEATNPDFGKDLYENTDADYQKYGTAGGFKEKPYHPPLAPGRTADEALKEEVE